MANLPQNQPRNGSEEVVDVTIVNHLNGPEIERQIQGVRKRHQWKNPTRPSRLHDSNLVRFIIFNTGDASENIVMDELRGTLDQGTFSAIARVKRIVQVGSHPRVDIWVQESAAIGIARSIREATRERTPKLLQALRGNMDRVSRAAQRLLSTRPVSKWRVARWVQWRERGTQPQVAGEVNRVNNKPEAEQCAIATWNINGFHSKLHNVVDLLENKNIVALCLQETLVSRHNYPLRIKGYISYETPKEEGFRGQAIIVDSRLHSYRIPHVEKDILHVKISGFKGNGLTFHLMGCYFPSGAQRRADRTRAWESLSNITKEILRKDPRANIVCCGDFNDPIARVQSQVEMGNILYLKPATLDACTRFPRRGDPSAIDHFVCSANAIRSCVHRPKILRAIRASDHAPMVARLRKVRVPASTPNRKDKPIWNREMIRMRSSPLVHHNRWQTLPVEDPTDEATLDALTTGFNETTEQIERELEIRRNGGGYCREMLPKPIRKKLKRYQLAKTAIEERELLVGDQESVARLTEYRKARKDFQSAVKFWKRSRGAKRYTRLSDDMLNGDLKAVWQSLNSNVDRQGDSRAVPPIRKADGTTVTEEKDVASEFREHYRRLAQDDPHNRRNDVDYWQRVLEGVKFPIRESLNELISWSEVIAAIRRMNRNTTPGSDGVHVNVLKALVMEESMATVKLRAGDSYRRLDNVRIDLPLDEFLPEPLTPMGKQMWRILRTAWELKKFPSCWHECVVISLYKSGDPEDTSNYRGITLMSVLEKVLLQIMQDRFGKEASKGDLISPEQTGFRTGEECIAQFITIHEVIRRRYRLNQPTYGVFVDFKKAYDKVHHGALFRACELKGVEGRTLDITKHIYENTRLRVRIGETLTEPFDMRRGIRQGDPYSPPTFDVFIDSVWSKNPFGEDGNVPATGVMVLGKLGLTHVQSGRYADDIVGLAPTSAGLQVMLDDLSEWGNRVEMELGIQKCGVMMWGGSEFERARFSEREFTTPWGTIPHTQHYKYLGINVTSEWHLSGNTNLSGNDDAARHVLRMREKGTRIAAILHPALRDPYCPIAIKIQAVRGILISSLTYGAEWYGCKKANTDPLDSFVSRTCKWIAGAKRVDTSYVGNVLKIELGLPSIEEHAAAMCMRLHAKLTLGDRVKTVIGTLASNAPAPTQGSENKVETWMSQNQGWYQRYVVPNLEKYKPDHENEASPNGRAWPLREALSRARMYEMHRKSNGYLSEYIEHINEVLTGITREGIIVDLDSLGIDGPALQRGWILSNRTREGPNYGSEQEDQFSKVHAMEALARGAVVDEQYIVMNTRDSILERRMTSSRTVGEKFYNMFNLVATRGWVRQTLQRTDLGEGFKWLLSVRVGGFPSVHKAWMRKRFTGQVPSWEDSKCPLCKAPIKERFEWIHLMMECVHHSIALSRNKHLRPLLENIVEMFNHPPGVIPEEWRQLAYETMGEKFNVRARWVLYRDYSHRWKCPRDVGSRISLRIRSYGFHCTTV